MMLSIHIAIGVITLISAFGSLVTLRREMIAATPYLLGGTLLSGTALIFINPAVSIAHLCASGLVLSVITLAVHKFALRRSAQFAA